MLHGKNFEVTVYSIPDVTYSSVFLKSDFKVWEKMQNKRMLTKIYHLSAILSTAPTSNGNWLSSALFWFILSWSMKCIVEAQNKKDKRPVGQWCFYLKLKTEQWSRCLFVHPSIPLEFSLQSRTRVGEGVRRGPPLPLPQRAGSQATLLLFEDF